MDFNKFVEFISHYTPNIILGIVIFILFWVFSKIIQYGIKKILARVNPETNVSNIISSIIKKLIVIVGFITSLGTIGINVSAIVAGLGLTGFAFGFAFKDMLSSFISGVMIFIYQPFKLGDIILVDGKEGEVVDVNLRYVTLKGEKSKMLVPNSLLVSKSLEVKEV
tara:strand:+ start:2359 stop:2856 length:498 start_codon:yes stop_codon:yes gene_type:complete